MGGARPPRTPHYYCSALTASATGGACTMVAAGGIHTGGRAGGRAGGMQIGGGASGAVGIVSTVGGARRFTAAIEAALLPQAPLQARDGGPKPASPHVLRLVVAYVLASAPALATVAEVLVLATGGGASFTHCPSPPQAVKCGPPAAKGCRGGGIPSLAEMSMGAAARGGGAAPGGTEVDGTLNSDGAKLDDRLALPFARLAPPPGVTGAEARSPRGDPEMRIGGVAAMGSELFSVSCESPSCVTPMLLVFWMLLAGGNLPVDFCLRRRYIVGFAGMSEDATPKSVLAAIDRGDMSGVTAGLISARRRMMRGTGREVVRSRSYASGLTTQKNPESSI